MTRMGSLNSRIRPALAALFAATVMLGMGLTSTAQAADFTVTSMADSEDPGTLRTAINDVAASVDVENRIVFDSGLAGTIELGSSLPVLQGPLEVKGPGSTQLAVDGADAYSIFAAFSDVTISGLTLRNGFSPVVGGAVLLQGGTSVLDGVSIVSSQSAAGGGVAMSVGTFTIKDSELIGNESPNGGGFYSADADLTISGTTVSGNEAGFGAGGFILGAEENTARIIGSRFTENIGQTGGGGLAVFAPSDDLSRSTRFEVTDSEFIQNSTTVGPFEGGLGGAGIFAGTSDAAFESTLFDRNISAGIGGALYLGSPFPTNKATVRNSTFTGNTAGYGGGAIGSIAFGLKVDSSTFTGNQAVNPPSPDFGGGGLWLGLVPASVTNSIVSGNTPSDISNSSQPGQPLPETSGSFNLIGKMPNANYTEKVPGSDITSSDPKLGPLADNGGPTQTMLPAATSPVVNKGFSNLDTDQRGLLRPVRFGAIPFSKAKQANGADIGAVELQTNKFSFGKVKLKKKTGIAILPVLLPGPGKISLKGSGSVKPQSKSAKKLATLKFTIRARGKALKKLRKVGTVKVKLNFAYSPTGGIATTKTKTIRLAMKKKRR